MTQSIEDQGTLKLISETLQQLVDDAKSNYMSYGIPTTEDEVRKLIFTVNETAIASNELDRKAVERVEI